MIFIACNLSNPASSSIDTSDVQSWQVGKCHKIICSTGNFYMVENERGDIDPETGSIKEYKVTYSHDKGFQCTCPAGNPPVDAYGLPLYAPKPCKHLKWSLAAAREEQQAMAEMAIAQASQIIKEAQAVAQAAKQEQQQEPTIEQLQELAKDMIVDGKPADIATVYRVHTAQPKKTNRNQKGIQSRPFSLMR